MAPTYTMSAHLCKQIYSSWRQTRATSPDSTSHLPPSPGANPPNVSAYYFPPMSRSSSPEKRSMDVDRPDSSASSRRSSSGSTTSTKPIWSEEGKK